MTDERADGMGEEADASRTHALAAAVAEVERHAASSGWDQPARMFALVDTRDLLTREPGLAEVLGVDGDEPRPFTPVEQEPVQEELEELLAEIVWPPEVAGCAAVVERLVLPPDADQQIPADAAEAAAFAAAHPDRQEVRIVAGALRSGESWCALRLRAHDDDASVVVGADLVPALLELLHATLAPIPEGPDDE